MPTCSALINRNDIIEERIKATIMFLFVERSLRQQKLFDLLQWSLACLNMTPPRFYMLSIFSVF